MRFSEGYILRLFFSGLCKRPSTTLYFVDSQAFAKNAFGQIKYDNHFKRFSYIGKRLVNAEFAAKVVAHNIRKMISKGYCVCSEGAVG